MEGMGGGEFEQDPRVEGTTVVAEPPGTKIVGRSYGGLITIFTEAAVLRRLKVRPLTISRTIPPRERAAGFRGMTAVAGFLTRTRVLVTVRLLEEVFFCSKRMVSFLV